MKKIIGFVMHEFDSIVAIVLGIVAVFYSLFGGDLSILLAGIAGILAVLAFGFIRDRRARASLNDAIQELQQAPSVGLILNDRAHLPPIRESTANAQHICFLGASVINTFGKHPKYFHRTKLQEHGAKIQVIILDPESPLIGYAAKCLDLKIEHLRNDCRRLLETAEEMVNDGVKEGSIEVRVMPTYPNYGMLFIDPEKPQGRLHIEFIGYQAPLEERPNLILLRSQDNGWFEYYYRQFQELWKDSEVRFSSNTQQVPE